MDNAEVYSSAQFGAYTDEEYVDLDIEGAERLTLVADSVGGNGNDHAVWADCKLTYYNDIYNDIKPDLRAYDVEFSSPYQVTEANILENARAYDFSGNDISGDITYTTDYEEGQIGEFEITYKVSDGRQTAQKRVKMKVLSESRFISGAGNKEYYYGQSNISVYMQAEEEVSSFFEGLTEDMTEGQMLYKAQNAYRKTIKYDNVDYADGAWYMTDTTW